MKSSETLGKIAPALVAALAEIGGVAKGANNPFFKSKYATLENVIDASKPVLAAHGISLLQFPGALVGGAMNLETILLHESGEWIGGEEAFGVSTTKADPQAVGSALSYARRYAQMAVLNMPAVDDDGEAAMPRGQKTQQPTAQPQQEISKQEDTHGPDWPLLVNPSKITSNAAKKDEALTKKAQEVKSKLDFASTLQAWHDLVAEVAPTVATFPETWRRVMWAEYEAVRMELEEAQ